MIFPREYIRDKMRKIECKRQESDSDEMTVSSDVQEALGFDDLPIGAPGNHLFGNLNESGDHKNCEYRGSDPFQRRFQSALSPRKMNRSVGHSEDRMQTSLMSKCMKENDSPWMAGRVSAGRTTRCSLSTERWTAFRPTGSRPISTAEMTKNEIQFARREKDDVVRRDAMPSDDIEDRSEEGG